jgi:hypothetical protein
VLHVFQDVDFLNQLVAFLNKVARLDLIPSNLDAFPLVKALVDGLEGALAEDDVVLQAANASVTGAHARNFNKPQTMSSIRGNGDLGSHSKIAAAARRTPLHHHCLNCRDARTDGRFVTSGRVRHPQRPAVYQKGKQWRCATAAAPGSRRKARRWHARTAADVATRISDV